MTNNLFKILIVPSLLIAFNSNGAEPAEAPAANQISISADKQEGQLKENVGIFEKNVEIWYCWFFIDSTVYQVVHMAYALTSYEKLFFGTPGKSLEFFVTL